jgi:hypothetical protein
MAKPVLMAVHDIPSARVQSQPPERAFRLLLGILATPARGLVPRPGPSLKRITTRRSDRRRNRAARGSYNALLRKDLVRIGEVQAGKRSLPSK